MFEREFSTADMVCIVENLFEDGEWAILEWGNPPGIRGRAVERFREGCAAGRLGCRRFAGGRHGDGDHHVRAAHVITGTASASRVRAGRH